MSLPKTLSFERIERGAKVIALYLKLTKDLSLNVKCYYLVGSDEIVLHIIYNDKYYKRLILYKELLMDIDDFQEQITIPFLKELMPNELKFIYQDCS